MSADFSIQLNGAARSFPAGSSVSTLLEALGFTGQPVLVELNGRPLLPREYAGHLLKAGDVVELVRIVAGG